VNDDPTFSIHELVAEFHIAPNTIHQYIHRGILPRPTRGHQARHPYETWVRLNELRRAKDRTRTLAEWAERFQSRDSASTTGTT
jgi:DNA-binding transcriptional MerR regulator